MRRWLLPLGLLAAVAGLSVQFTAQAPPAQAASYNGPLPNNWFDLHRQRAAQFAQIPPSKVSGWDTDFATTAAAGSWSTVVTGSGAATALPPLGGRLQLSTGATASSTARANNGQLTVVPSTAKFYAASRLRVVTTSGANTDNRLVSVNNTLANDNVCLRLTNGVLNLELASGGAKTTVATAWTPETASYHDFAISNDRVTVRAFVDDVQVGSTTTLTNLTPGECNWDCTFQNGGTAADQQGIVDKAALYVEAP